MVARRIGERGLEVDGGDPAVSATRIETGRPTRVAARAWRSPVALAGTLSVSSTRTAATSGPACSTRATAPVPLVTVSSRSGGSWLYSSPTSPSSTSAPARCQTRLVRRSRISSVPSASTSTRQCSFSSHTRPPVSPAWQAPMGGGPSCGARRQVHRGVAASRDGGGEREPEPPDAHRERRLEAAHEVREPVLGGRGPGTAPAAVRAARTAATCASAPKNASGRSSRPRSTRRPGSAALERHVDVPSSTPSKGRTSVLTASRRKVSRPPAARTAFASAASARSSDALRRLARAREARHVLVVHGVDAAAADAVVRVVLQQRAPGVGELAARVARARAARRARRGLRAALEQRSARARWPASGRRARRARRAAAARSPRPRAARRAPSRARRPLAAAPRAPRPRRRAAWRGRALTPGSAPIAARQVQQPGCGSTWSTPAISSTRSRPDRARSPRSRASARPARSISPADERQRGARCSSPRAAGEAA